MAEAASLLSAAAAGLRPLDPPAARDALLSALEAIVFAGWASSIPLLREVTRTAHDLAPPGTPSDAAADLLLQGYAARVTGGHAAAMPVLRRAVEAFLAEELEPALAFHRLELAALTASDLLDDVAAEALNARCIDRARAGGVLARLAGVLAFRSAFVDAPGGRLAAARAAEWEAHELAEATGNPAVVPPTGAHTLPGLVLGGRETEARATAAAVAREASARGAAGEAAFAAYWLGVLEISLGNYGSAVACLNPAYSDDTPLAGTQALPDLVEAAVRAGERELAEHALQRLEDRATAAGTPLALGLLARSRGLLESSAGAREEYENALALLDRDSGRSPTGPRPPPLRRVATPPAPPARGTGAPPRSPRHVRDHGPALLRRAGPCGAAGHRRARTQAGSGFSRGADPPGGAHRDPGEPR